MSRLKPLESRLVRVKGLGFSTRVISRGAWGTPEADRATMSRLKPLESRWGSRWVLMRELMSWSFAASSGSRIPRDFCRIITAESDTVSETCGTCSRVGGNWKSFGGVPDCWGMQSRPGSSFSVLQRGQGGFFSQSSQSKPVFFAQSTKVWLHAPQGGTTERTFKSSLGISVFGVVSSSAFLCSRGQIGG